VITLSCGIHQGARFLIGGATVSHDLLKSYRRACSISVTCRIERGLGAFPLGPGFGEPLLGRAQPAAHVGELPHRLAPLPGGPSRH
jgi:hypothetical protein